MNFEDNAMSEISAAVLSVNGPYIDISNPDNLFEQEMPLNKYSDEPDEKFPLVLLYIDGEVSEQVANDRFEISINVDLSVIYKINRQTEKISDGLERGRRCLRQVVRKILDRQRAGEALAALYLSGDVQLEATDDRGINHRAKDLVNGTATAKFTLRHIEPKEREDA